MPRSLLSRNFGMFLLAGAAIGLAPSWLIAAPVPQGGVALVPDAPLTGPLLLVTRAVSQCKL